MGGENKCSHHGQVIQVKKRDEFPKIQKNKLRPHQHTGEQIPPDKHAQAVNRDPSAGNRKQDSAYTGRLP